MTTDVAGISVQSSEVAAALSCYDESVRDALLGLRRLILDTAAETQGVGRVDEVLRWGQPSYLTAETRSGSTIRIAPARPGSDHDYAMFFICHTNLVESFKDLFGDVLDYDGNRALAFSVGIQLPEREVRTCIAMALTYHQANKRLK